MSAQGMDNLLNKSLLFDFYGELLNGYQKEIYEDYTFNDLSLAELGEQHNITRQAVFNIIKRCDKKLSDYEEKLHLVEKFLEIREMAREILDISDNDRIKELAEKITDIY